MNRWQRMDVIAVAVNLLAAWAWLLPLTPRMWSSDHLSGALSGDSDMKDGTRGALGATLAALRAYQRAAQATSKRLVARVEPDLGADAASGVEEFSDDPSRSQTRRNLLFIGGGSALAVAAFLAAVFGVLEAQPGQPRTVIEPYGAVPAATSSAAPVSGAATGRAAKYPVSAGGSAKSSAPSAAALPSGSPASIDTPGATSSVVATATTSPSLVDICRSVVAAGNSWPSVLKPADRATVTAAAGTKKNVLPYCNSLLAGTPTS